MTTTRPQLSLGTLATTRQRDWREPLRGALALRGFDSATAYADSRPNAPLSELAQDLDLADIVPTFLERALVEEAEAAGAMARCARSLLARDLRDELPQGWPREWTPSARQADSPLFRRAGVFLSLTMAMPEQYEPAVERIRRAMAASDIPAGWLPEGADDPLLVEIFARHWPEPPV